MKNETAKIRLTAEEKRYLMSEAKRLGITLSSLIRNHIAINPQSINPQ
jgi:hypothetical protein